MILRGGDQVLVAHRRLFAEDHPRYFAGVVEQYENGLAVVSGYTWLRDPMRGELQRKPDRRTKILSLASGTLLVYKLGPETNLEALRLETGAEGESVLTDGGELRMDLTERTHR